MSISKALESRCDAQCELCGAQNELHSHVVAPKTGLDISEQIAICSKCINQIENEEQIDINHWRCLNDSAWSAEPAVQVTSYRMLNKLRGEGWAQDLLGIMYMEGDTKKWAQSLESDVSIVHKDSNGNILKNGDTVTLIKDLDVKGGGFTAKRGAAVRRISLVADNAEHIQGRINDQTIIILTKFVKK
ncbi:MAG: PhnA domain-containing protein [Saprospiraceae bacterium]